MFQNIFLLQKKKSIVEKFENTYQKNKKSFKYCNSTIQTPIIIILVNIYLEF